MRALLGAYVVASYSSVPETVVVPILQLPNEPVAREFLRNRLLQLTQVLQILVRGTRHLGNNTVIGWVGWGGILAVTWIVAFIIAEVIPFFSDLLSIMSSLFDSFFGFIFWGTAYIRMRKADYGDGYITSRGWKSILGLVVNITLILIGLLFLSAGTYASVESIILGYEADSFGGAFTCASNGL